MCANAGVDLSNVDAGQAALLPKDGDRSAHRIRNSIRVATRLEVGGRHLRHVRSGLALGLTDVAIGVAGIAAVVDLRGDIDSRGQDAARHRGRDRRRGCRRRGTGDGQEPSAFRPRSSADWTRAWFDDGSVRELIRPPERGLVPLTASATAVACVPISKPGVRSVHSPRTRSRQSELDLRQSACRAPPHRTTPGRGDSSRSRPPRPSSGWPTPWGTGGGPTSPPTASRARAIDELVESVHQKLTGAPSLVLGCLTWDGLDRYPDADPAAGRVGHGAAVARCGGREPHARRGRSEPRVVLGRGADLLPRRRARRARARPGMAAPRDGARRSPGPGLPSGGLGRRSRSRNSAPAGDARQPSAAGGTSRACGSRLRRAT